MSHRSIRLKRINQQLQLHCLIQFSNYSKTLNEAVNRINKQRSIITGRNEVVAKAMFLHMCVILFTGGSLGGSLGRENPPGQGEPPRADTPQSKPPSPGSRPPWEQTPGSRPPQEQTPLGADPLSRHPLEQTTPLGSTLQHMVNEWPVRILLECILV